MTWTSEDDRFFAKAMRTVNRLYPRLLAVAICLGLLAGCVSTEQYEAEKSRALNFQRLLAQEERRSGQLNVQVQESQRKTEGLKSQNRDLTNELLSLRDQFSRAQEELTHSTEHTDMTRTEQKDVSLPEDSLSEFGLSDITFDDEDFQDLGIDEPTYHIVKKGETLYSISRQHGVAVSDLKSWNTLTNNLIAIGQRLTVSNPF